MSTVGKSTQLYSQFDPRSLGSCALWLDAADPSTLTFSSGSNLQTWRNKAGSGGVFTQAGTASRLTQTSVNGSPAVVFDSDGGSSNAWMTGTLALPTNSTFIQVITPIAYTSGTWSFYWSWQWTTNGTRVPGLRVDNAGATLQPYITWVGNGGNGIPIVYGTQCVSFVEFTGGGLNTRYSINGAAPSSGTIIASTIASSTFLLGGDGNSGATVFGKYRLSELLMFSETLTTAERQQVEGYLAWKWGTRAVTGPTITVAPEFNPLAIVLAPTLWLDAADASVFTLSGSNVMQWNDKSGNGYNFSQTTSTRQPTYDATNRQLIFTGNNQNSASNQALQNTSIPVAGTSYSIFAVARGNASQPSFTGYNYVVAPAIASPQARLAFASLSGNFATFTGSGTSFNDLNANTPAISVRTSTRILCMIVSGSTLTPFYDGIAMNTKVGTTGSFTGLVVGDAFSPDSGQCWNGSINEVLFYPFALTTPQRQQVETYLGAKWGLSASLPQPRPALSPFVPRAVPQVALWLDAADASSVIVASGTSNVTQWNDKSGNNGNVSTTSNFPLYASSQFGTLPGIQFSGTNFLQGPLTTNTAQATMIIVYTMNRTTLPAGGGSRLVDFNNNNYGNFGSPQVDAGVGINSDAFVFLAGTAYPSQSLYTTLAPQVGSRMYAIVYNGTSSQLYRNGSLQPVGGSGFSGTANGTEIALGGLSIRPANDRFIGSVAEVLFFRSILSNTDRQTVEAYLSRKWGIPLTLPLALPLVHPYSLRHPFLRPFIPLDLGGCALWLDAADQSSMSLVGSNVSQWRDKSGNGNTPTFGSIKPTYVDGYVLASYTSENYNSGINRQFSIPSAAISTSAGSAGSMFMVYADVTPVGLYSALFGVAPSSGNFAQGLKRPDQFGFGYPGITTYPPPGGFVGAINTSNVLLYTFNYVYASTTGTIRINGTTRIGSFQAAVTPSANELWIGSAADGSAARLRLYEIVMFKRTLSTPEQEQVEAYLAGKWGLRGSTPSTHLARISPALSPQFNPLNLGSCALWLDAADPSVLTLSGSNVTQWRDKSGNLRHATNAGTGNPVWSASIINGVAAIQFNVGNFLTTPSFTMNTITRTAFIVYRHTATAFPANTTYYNFYPLAGTTTNSFQLYFYRENVAPYEWRAGFGISFVGGFPNGPAYFSGNTQPANPNFLICTQRTTSNTGVMTYNGTTQSISFTNTTSLFPATDVLQIGGASTDTGVGGSISGHHIGEVLLYNTALTPPQRQQVEGYLARKWGLLGTLTAPTVTLSTIPSPLAIGSAPVLWLDAADSSTVTLSGSNVTQWRDKSGNNRHTTTFQNAPTFSNQSVQFSSNQGFSVDLTASTNVESAFIVTSVVNAGSNINTLLGSGNGHGGRQFRIAGTIQTIQQNVVGVVFTGATLPLNTRHLVGFVNTGTTLTHFWNGATYASGPSVSYTAGRTTSIGFRWENFEPLNGSIQELLVYPFALTTVQRRQVETYLGAKWGLSDLLPQPTPALSPFVPQAVPQVSLWLDAADPAGTGVLPADASNVTTWVDKSGNNYNVSQNAALAVPRFRLGLASNGRPGMDFTGGAGLLSATSFAKSLNVTLFLVGMVKSTIGSWGTFWGHFPVGDHDFNAIQLRNTSGQAVINWHTNNNNTTSQLPYVLDSMVIYTCTMTAGNVMFLQQITATGTTSVTITNAAVSINTAVAPIWVGRSQAGEPINSFIYEIAYFQQVLSLPQRQQVEAYLGQKWGIQPPVIPNSHPYKMTPLL